MEINNETLSLIETLRDDAEALSSKSNEVFGILKMVVSNEKVRGITGVSVGDFFKDKNGEIGVFMGCSSTGSCWGRMITKKHYGYVYPAKKITHKQALERISERISDLI